MNHFSHMDVLSKRTSLLSIATKQIRTRSLRNSETKQSRVNLILVNYHATNYRTIDIMKVHRKSINNLRRTWFWFALFLTRVGTLRMLLLTTLTSGSRSTSATLWIMMMMTFLVLWITSDTTTNFTACWWKLCFSYILWNLTDTRFSWLGKSFHTIFTTTIPRFKFFLFFFLGLFFLILRMILWVFTSENKILFWAAITTTSLTSLISKMSSSLISGYNTDTSFLIFVSISMFTFFAAIFVSDSTLTFLLHDLFWCNTFADFYLIFINLLLFSLLNAFILPFLIFRGAAWDRAGRRRVWRSWSSFLLLRLIIIFIFNCWWIPYSLVGNIFEEWVVIVMEVLLMLLFIIDSIIFIMRILIVR